MDAVQNSTCTGGHYDVPMQSIFKNTKNKDQLFKKKGIFFKKYLFKAKCSPTFD